MNGDEAPDGSHNRASVYRIGFGMLLFFYVSSYLVLSKMGRYEPVAVGAGNVKQWQWKPEGFRGFGEKTPVSWQLCFYPLWTLDLWLWHTDEKARTPGYPSKIWDTTTIPPRWHIITP